MADELDGRRIAMLVAPRGSEEPEVLQPRDAARGAGASVDLITLEGSTTAKLVNSDLDPGEELEVHRTLDEASAEDYDALIVPGGTVGSDTLRGSKAAVAFIRGMLDAGKPAAVICHGPWTLVEADAVRGRRLTSFPTLRTDIVNAGGDWVDEEVVVDDDLVTSRSPADLDAFCRELVKVFAS